MSEWPSGRGEIATRIRDLNWAATALGPVAGWSERLKLMVEQVLASPLVSSLVCGPERVLIYNDAAAKLYGDRHPQALGRPLPDAFPEGWATVAPFYERAFTGESVVVTGQPVDTRGEGDAAADVFDAYLTPVHEAGAIAHVHAIGIEIGERSRAEAKLRASEERFQHVVRATRDIVWDIDLVADRVWWSEALQTELGFAAEDIGPDTAWCFAHMHPNDRERVIAGMKKAAAGTDSVWSDEFRYQRADGTYAHIADRGFITRNASGLALRMTGAMRDVTTRKHVEATLRASEERQAFLLKLSDTLRAEHDPDKVGQAAVDMLARHMGVDRCYVARSTPAGLGWVGPEHYASGLPPMAGEYRVYEDFPEAMRRLEVKPLIIHDLWNDPALSERDKIMIAALEMQALFVGALRKGKEFFWGLALGSRSPRAWTEADRMLIEEAADRTWAAIERARGELALRESEARFAQFAENSSDALWILDAQSRQLEYLSPAYERIWGESREVVMADLSRWVELAHPDDRAAASQALPRLLAGEAFVTDYRIVRPDGGVRWIRDTGFPIHEGGLVKRGGGIAQDVTDLKRTETALHAIGARQRALIEGMPQLVWRAVDGGHWTWASPQWTAFTGQSEPESRGWGWLDPVHPDDREVARVAWSRAIETGTFEVDYRICHAPEQRYRWFQTRAAPVRDKAGAIIEWLGTSTDIDDLRTLQVRQEVLVNELQHRARNLLGVVTAVADRTVKQGGSVQAFEERLQALSRAQGLLSQGGSDTVEVGALVRAELAAHVDGPAAGLSASGPEVQLTARQVQNFALALHELTTNAVKYGALKGNAGHLTVSWEVVLDRRERRRLALNWVESGVAVEPAKVTRRGYGTELIQEALAYALEADVDYELGQDGVRCRIEMPIT